MGKIIDDELKNLLVQKQILARKESKRELTEEQYKEQIEPINKRAMEITQEHIRLDWVKNHPDDTDKKYLNNEITTDINKSVSMEENKMVEENKKEVKKEATKEDKAPSNAQYILKALQMRSVKTYDDVAAKVKEWKPTIVDRRIKAMAKTMIKEIGKGVGKKATMYKWDAENFLLTPVV